MTLDLTMASPVYNASGKFSYALSGGTGSLSSVLPNFPVTVEAWVQSAINLPGSGTYYSAVGQLSAFWIGMDTALGAAAASFGTEILTTTIPINHKNFNDFHHLALCIFATGAEFYVDGVLGASSSNAPSGYDYTTNSLSVRGAIANLAWQGKVDEVVIWRGRKYTAPFTPRTSAYVGNEDLVALYHLDQSGVNSKSDPYFVSRRSSSADTVTNSGGRA